MSVRKPLPHAEQVALMKTYVRKLHTQLNHRYQELFATARKRRECPLEVSLRSRMVEVTRDTVGLAEASLEELRRQEAMFYAPFTPGDRITVEYVDRGTTVVRGPYLVVDIRPGKKAPAFCYEVQELTKAGALHKRRWRHSVCPSERITIKPSDIRLNTDGEWEARYYRECAQTSRVLAFERGDLTLFEAREGFLGGKSFHRKDRMAP
jgi:hypothetical protein